MKLKGLFHDNNPLKENNDEVRKDAMDNNAGVRRDAKPIESKAWHEKMYNENISKLTKTDQSKIDKVEDLEQIVINQGAKQRENYMLINDRVDEAFDIIKMLERKV